MKVIKTAVETWENRHETFVENIKDLYELGNEAALDALNSYNDATKGLQKLIADAVSTNTPLRMLGAGWSWTKIATVNNGIMLDAKPLNTVFNITANSVSPDYAGKPEHLIFAQGGTGIWELGKFLKQKGLSLKTSGASNGQTITGAIGTGAHGSAFDFGAVQDFVVGLHIVVGANRHVWVERASYPVASATFIQNINAELIQDDDIFNSALISFGSFGIIHGVMAEVEDLFLLEGYMRRIPYDDALKTLMTTLDFTGSNLPGGSERPYHFAVLLNPYDMDKGAYVTTMYKRPYVTGYQPPVDNPEGIGPGDDAPSFIGLLTDAIPALVPTLVNKLLTSSLTLYEKQLGTVSEIFSNTTLRGKLLSAAVGIPLEEVTRVAELMIDINKTIGPFTGLFSFRYVKQTKATMGFTRYPYTCVMELDAAFSDKTYAFYTKVWKKLEDEGIPFTFHWGKVNELSPQRISAMYGADADKWVAARNKLLDADTIKIFNNPLLAQWGLDTILP
jgi:hypothetical protein